MKLIVKLVWPICRGGRIIMGGLQYRQILMGNICNGAHDRDDLKETSESLSKNISVCEFTLRNNCAVQLILGTCRHHKGSLLLAVLQQENLEFSTELRDYSQNYTSVVDSVVSTRKRLLQVSISRNCPYKKFYLCVLPSYNTNERENYLQQFENMMQEVVDSSTDLTLQLNHTFQNTNGLPNQTLMAVFFKNILVNLKRNMKVSIVSSEPKLLNMVRYEIVKLGEYKVKNFLKDKETAY